MSTETVSNAADDSPAFPGCLTCEQAFDPERKVVYDTEHFLGYATPVYPWGVMLTTRRHDCDGPWALTEAEAADLGKMVARVAAAIRKTGSEGAYLMVFGEEGGMPHFHLGVLARYLPLSETERAVLYGRVQADATDAVQVAAEFAAAARANVTSTDVVGAAAQDSGPVADCMTCEQVFDPERMVVHDTEHFVGYVTPRYPWAVMLTTRRHDCDGPWALTEAEAVDMGKAIPRLTEAIRATGSDRVYILAFGEESAKPHFHVGLLSRHLPLSEAEHRVMWERVEHATSDLVQDADDFAASVRANL